MLSFGHILISDLVVTDLFMNSFPFPGVILSLGHAFFTLKVFYIRYHHFCKVSFIYVTLSHLRSRGNAIA